MISHAQDEPPIVPIGVKDPAFTLDLIARECPRMQFIREYTKNGIEAIDAYRRLVARAYEGRVLWTVAPDALGLAAPKLAVIDTGIGMTATELPAYVNDLTSSGKTRSLHDNYGVGAKVSAARFNPEGVLYFTWRDGVGSFVALGRDREGTWGMRQHRRPAGIVTAVLRVPDELKPAELEGLDHGTMVVFLGERADEDTTAAPAGGEFNDDRWIAKYLNRRFYRLPDWAEVRVREQKVDGVTFMRRVRGQAAFLAEHTVAEGTVTIAAARVHWRVLTDEGDNLRRDDIWAGKGHRAALMGDELYEMVSPKRGGYQKLQEFGIHSGYSRVVLYVEPAGEVGAMTDTARTRLLVDGEPLPWDRYAEQFEAKMPQAIKDLIEQAVSATSRDYRKQIRERLEAIRELFRVPRYRPRPQGPVEMDHPTTGSSREDDDHERGATERPDDVRPVRESSGPAAGNVYALMLHADGPQAEKVRTDKLPDIDVDWVSADDRRFSVRSRPHLEDRAARYDLRHNRLEINYDFRGLQDLIARWRRQFAKVPGAKPIVEETVMGWYEQQLTETVLGVLALRGSEYWDERTVEQALSEVALTAAAGPRYHIDQRVRHELAGRFLSGRRATAA